MSDESLRVREIFLSLQGEGRTTGWPTVFVRLTGCPLRCGYCDTAYAFSGGERLDRQEILRRVTAFAVRHVTVTGGEPLAQVGVLPLMTALCDQGLQVSLETSGALPVEVVDPRVVRVMDLKTPGSGELARNRWENIDHLRPQDQIKFVITGREDYDWAVETLQKYHLAERCEVLFSPAQPYLEAQHLADWVVADRLPVRFQIQLHKYLWGDVPGR